LAIRTSIKNIKTLTTRAKKFKKDEAKQMKKGLSITHRGKIFSTDKIQ